MIRNFASKTAQDIYDGENSRHSRKIPREFHAKAQRLLDQPNTTRRIAVTLRNIVHMYAKDSPIIAMTTGMPKGELCLVSDTNRYLTENTQGSLIKMRNSYENILRSVWLLRGAS